MPPIVLLYLKSSRDIRLTAIRKPSTGLNISWVKPIKFLQISLQINFPQPSILDKCFNLFSSLFPARQELYSNTSRKQTHGKVKTECHNFLSLPTHMFQAYFRSHRGYFFFHIKISAALTTKCIYFQMHHFPSSFKIKIATFPG